MAASAIPASTNAQIEASTRPLWKEGVKDQVLLKMPLFAKLFDRKRFMWRSGNLITQTVKTQEIDPIFQSYAVGEGMNGGRVLNLTKPYFFPKLAQLPVSWDVDEELFNNGGDPAPIDLAMQRVKDAAKGTRIGLYKMIYSASSTDTGTGFNSVVQALNHDATYAGVTRATTATNKWFQGGSLADSYTDQDDAVSPSIDLIRRMIDKMMENADEAASLMFIMGPANYIKLKNQVDASGKFEYGPMKVNYGFDSFTIDGVEIVKDYYLTAANLPAESSPQKWVFGINADDWELSLNPRRAFNLTPYVWQGDRVNGTDSWLARVMLTGNLCCWKPNGSIWRSNVS